jgi:hypothetical protein
LSAFQPTGRKWVVGRPEKSRGPVCRCLPTTHYHLPTSSRPVRLLVRLPAQINSRKGQAGQVGFESHTGQSVESGESRARKNADANVFSGSGLWTLVSRPFPATWCNWQTRDAQNVVPLVGLGVRLSPWSLMESRDERPESGAGNGQSRELHGWLSTLVSRHSTFLQAGQVSDWLS